MTRAVAEVRCFKCQAIVAPNDKSCSSCNAPLASGADSTQLVSQSQSRPEAPAILNRPDPDALPPRRRKVIIPVAAFVLGLIFLLAYTGRLDRSQQIAIWAGEVATELRNPRSRYKLQTDDQKLHAGPVFYIGAAIDLPLFQKIPLPPRFSTGEEGQRYSFFERRPRLTSDYYAITIVGRRPVFFTAANFVERGGRPLLVFKYSQQSLLTAGWAKWSILLLLLIVPAIDRGWIWSYRRKQQRVYEVYERERTALVYQAREQVMKARELVASGEPAKALVAVGEALNSLPDYSEATELKRLILSMAAERASVVVAGEFAPRMPDVDHVLYLRVVGTPYAYRAQPGAATVRVGRQRPKTEEDAAESNDLVIRVPASADRTLRISRRHFEINRIGREYFVVDHSHGQTRLNGTALVPGKPSKVVDGDRLLVADVMALEISVRSGSRQLGARIVQVGADAARFNLEATVGDMLTEV